MDDQVKLLKSYIKDDLTTACKRTRHVEGIKKGLLINSLELVSYIGNVNVCSILEYDDIFSVVSDVFEREWGTIDDYSENDTETIITDCYIEKIKLLNEYYKHNDNDMTKKNEVTEPQDNKIKAMFDKLMPDSVLGKVCTAIVLFVIGKKVWKSKTVQEYWQKLQDFVENVTEEDEEESTKLRDDE